VFRISAIQKLKANHNNISYATCGTMGVPNISYSEIESKSQQRKTNLPQCFRCSEYQLFRNWKQITTVPVLKPAEILVFRISAIQKLKANHNINLAKETISLGVPNISYSEIESKSQRRSIRRNVSYGCSEYQLFRNWKQITTICSSVKK